MLLKFQPPFFQWEWHHTTICTPIIMVTQPLCEKPLARIPVPSLVVSNSMLCLLSLVLNQISSFALLTKKWNIFFWCHADIGALICTPSNEWYLAIPCTFCFLLCLFYLFKDGALSFLQHCKAVTSTPFWIWCSSLSRNCMTVTWMLEHVGWWQAIPWSNPG